MKRKSLRVSAIIMGASQGSSPELFVCFMFLQWCMLVQGLNQGVTVEGKKKVDVLRATKDFKKGIYGLQWEHTRGNMDVLYCAAL